MRDKCKNCILNDDIERNKEKLLNMIVDKNYNFSDAEIIKVSQSVDTLVDKCIVCEKNLALNSNM